MTELFNNEGRRLMSLKGECVRQLAGILDYQLPANVNLLLINLQRESYNYQNRLVWQHHNPNTHMFSIIGDQWPLESRQDL